MKAISNKALNSDTIPSYCQQGCMERFMKETYTIRGFSVRENLIINKFCSTHPSLKIYTKAQAVRHYLQRSQTRGTVTTLYKNMFYHLYDCHKPTLEHRVRYIYNWDMCGRFFYET